MPVFGAGTSNSEFEFLSGDSISFLPTGCNVYQSYVKDTVPSLVSTLGALGYSRTAFHPYYGEGWNRRNVYPLLGFENYISIEDFVDQDILDTYKQNNDVTEYEMLLNERYPDRNMLLRRFVSDSYDYSMVENMTSPASMRSPTRPRKTARTALSLTSPCRTTAATPCPIQTFHRKYMSQT